VFDETENDACSKVYVGRRVRVWRFWQGKVFVLTEDQSVSGKMESGEKEQRDEGGNRMSNVRPTMQQLHSNSIEGLQNKDGNVTGKLALDLHCVHGPFSPQNRNSVAEVLQIFRSLC